MTENQKELIKLIRESQNPEESILTALMCIIDYLKQPESSEVPSSACPQEQD
jgi:hypothetical protein